jgi:hypothetical protein
LKALVYTDKETLDFRDEIDAVGFADTRKKSIKTVKQGGVIIHIGLSQSGSEFDFRKTTLQ